MTRALLLLAVGLVGAPARGGELLQQLSPDPLQAESTMDALEPWETPIEGFFIRSHHGEPVIDESSWTLTIDGLVESTRTLTLPELRRMPAKSLHAVLECAGNGRGLQRPAAPGLQWKRGAVGNAEWTGVPVAELLRLAGVKPGARFARLEGADLPRRPGVPAFVRSVPVARLLAGDSLVALEMDRQPLPPLHGGPARLVLPGWYGENWTKWLTRITLTEGEDPGFFMKKGYRMPRTAVPPGEPWDSATGRPIEEIRVQALIVSPAAGRTVAAVDLPVRGKAFSGAAPVSSVEVSADGGKSWLPAALDKPRPGGGWQAFEALVSTPAAGTLTILARAADAAGNRQPAEHEWNPPGYLRNAVDRVSVVVGDSALPAGLAVLTRRCLMCHAQELIAGQRLAPKQWAGVVKKMEGFGVLLEAPERQALMDYLSTLSPDRPESIPVSVDYLWAAAPAAKAAAGGDAGRGRKLFAENCASCHGERGEGHEGPRLRGRPLPDERFRLTVLHGKGAMPGFAEALSAAEIADLAAFLAAERP